MPRTFRPHRSSSRIPTTPILIIAPGILCDGHALGDADFPAGRASVSHPSQELATAKRAIRHGFTRSIALLAGAPPGAPSTGRRADADAKRAALEATPQIATAALSCWASCVATSCSVTSHTRPAAAGVGRRLVSGLSRTPDPRVGTRCRPASRSWASSGGISAKGHHHGDGRVVAPAAAGHACPVLLFGARLTAFPQMPKVRVTVTALGHRSRSDTFATADCSDRDHGRRLAVTAAAPLESRDGCSSAPKPWSLLLHPGGWRIAQVVSARQPLTALAFWRTCHPFGEGPTMRSGLHS